MKKLLLLGIFCAAATVLSAFNINRETGIWSGLDSGRFHRYDNTLSDALIEFFKNEKAHTLVDFGCGLGSYVRAFQKAGFDAQGCDGNPDTIELTKGLCDIRDLTEAFDLGRRFDWVVSLEVGEHIPKPFEKTFIENLVHHADKGIILSWAPKRQRGRGHFNEQNNDYVKDVMAQYGFTADEKMEVHFRESSRFYWFKNSIMVFRRT